MKRAVFISFLFLTSCYSVNPRPQKAVIEKLMTRISEGENLDQEISLPFWNGILPRWKSSPHDFIQIGQDPFWIRSKEKLKPFITKAQSLPHKHAYKTTAKIFPLKSLQHLAPKHLIALKKASNGNELKYIWVAKLKIQDTSSHQHLENDAMILIRWVNNHWEWAGILG